MKFAQTCGHYAVLAAIAAGALVSAPASARDTKYLLPIQDVLNMPEAREKLDGSVRFFFAGQRTPKVLETKGSDVSNRKTNGVGKSDEEACRWAALSALLSFQDKAKTMDANAVVNLVSYYKKNEMASADQYECHAGAVVVGVALKGDYARVGN
ncbi:excinuclease ATPase subunit [Cupriavidus gilardii]|uniref:excinuclease ATPase subunit n=1 Tax=Cupriavidus gilardii TaxID=82541 RepID=UPI0015747913|nr:excinuclease ATPase subunit [Cupriavidus gilardii]MCG5258766.1 excinuclease ATPase subunit [Cupriavidus gilardii]MDF9429283.1 excinuclease ATPase subunit [Cupriavidus gilardii]NSX04364.1 excinuclease ATPase subunit [Cupriavidus gilardii]